MNRYIESHASVTAVQFWNTESCMEELKQLGLNPITIQILDGSPRLIVKNDLIGKMQAEEGDYIVKIDDDAGGMIVVLPKDLFEQKYRVYDASEECDTASEPPSLNDPETAF